MLLPVMPPVSPMLAKPVTVIPPGASYEPKWDGFRALVFRDGDDVEFGSRNERPMTRYFPELVRAAKAELPPRCVVDGEIVLPTEKGLDFEALQLRLHPAASRVRLLAEHTPARFIAFDLLALGDDNLMDRPFSERRAALARALGSGPSFHVTPATTDIATARRWFDEFEGAGLDGLIAKGLTLTYQPDKREMVKVKHHRDADCVAIGYRIHKSGEGVGSILLGLYRADGELQMVGGAASFSVKDRLKLLADLEPLREGDEVREGDPSRWNSAADKRWIPVRPEKVCEVAYDQMEGNTDNGRRFRHAVKFMRWRPDREPSSCTFDQLDVPLNYDLYDVLAKEG
ncbi:ATP-dependent DNA ligase [Mycolicibacterium fortuitum]|uniref:ATP-dependent DNA ligase n=1 Tax=Mycolicibacterium fortuitum TaxID=1766 RepID=UPI0007EB4CD1|nr:ATP-dependent DNA ligase [Mycolicibacterium fortuitum]OBG52242.1 ATP-dependent DNA ligase [Mycolicibacterium fortuitum]